VPLLAGEQMATVDIPVMVGVAILCVPLFFIGSVLNRIEGLLFMLLYVAYTWYLVAMALKESYLGELQQGILYGLLPAVVLFVLLSFVHDRMKNKDKIQ
jgi:cation:H+ antiporter